MLPLIDTHQHLWDLSHLELPWTGGIPQLNKNFLMSDYLEASEGQNVSKTVYMEVDAHQHHRQREVEFINEICSDDSNPMPPPIHGRWWHGFALQYLEQLENRTQTLFE